MPVKVDLLESVPVILLEKKGSVSRQESGWAAERARELILREGAQAILIDAQEVEIYSSPSHASEIIENFLLAIEKPLPIAFLAPREWTDAHFREAGKRTAESAVLHALFEDRTRAMEWLQQQLDASQLTGEPG